MGYGVNFLKNVLVLAIAMEATTIPANAQNTVITGARMIDVLTGKTAELVEADFMHTVFPHPTLSEMMHESVLGAYGKMLHM